MNKGKIKQ